MIPIVRDLVLGRETKAEALNWVKYFTHAPKDGSGRGDSEAKVFVIRCRRPEALASTIQDYRGNIEGFIPWDTKEAFVWDAAKVEPLDLDSLLYSIGVSRGDGYLFRIFCRRDLFTVRDHNDDEVVEKVADKSRSFRFLFSDYLGKGYHTMADVPYWRLPRIY